MLRVSLQRILALGVVLSALFVVLSSQPSGAAPLCQECDVMINQCYADCRGYCGTDDPCIWSCGNACNSDTSIIWCYDHCIGGGPTCNECGPGTNGTCAPNWSCHGGCCSPSCC